MIKRFKFVFLLVILMAATSCGQQKKYVSYTIRKGETMKSIAKDNDMRVRDLLNLNPDISRRPEPNTVIIIPSKKKKKTSGTSSAGEKIHTVKKKETLFSISQKYGVTVESLKKANDLIGNNISIGRELIIPPKKIEEEVEEPQEQVEEEVENIEIPTEEIEGTETTEELKDVFHTVEKGDTVYNLTRRFEISEEELLDMNPIIKDEGLKLGMIIKVGAMRDEEPMDEYFVDQITDKPLNIVLMLPYKLDSISNYNEKFKRKNSLLNIVTDFHSGVLFAVDSLKNQGLNVNLKVFDTENNSDKITSILKENDFSDVDAIIGPLFLKNAKLVAKKEGSTPVIAPMYSKEQTSISDGSLVKVSPNKELLEEKLTNYMLENYSGEKIIIVYDTITASPSRVLKISDELKKHDSINEITILTPENGYIKKERFKEVIDTLQRKNWVLLIGKDNVTTNDVVNNLGVMSKEKAKIQLFSFDKGPNFVNVSNHQLGRLHFTYPTKEFIDDLDEATQVFQKKYRAKYYRIPSKYAIKGFDVAYDALLRLANFDTFKAGAKSGISKRIANKFKYTKRFFGSIENKGVFLIQYQEDLKLKIID